jgi:hypothetical protein
MARGMTDTLRSFLIGSFDFFFVGSFDLRRQSVRLHLTFTITRSCFLFIG